VLFTTALQSSLSMSDLQLSTELAGWFDAWLHDAPAVQHCGMSLPTQSCTVKPTSPQRLIACEQNSVTIDVHCAPMVCEPLDASEVDPELELEPVPASSDGPRVQGSSADAR
jgi:hypothetical protein